MTQIVFAVYDIKAGFYMQPYFSESVGLAIRAFGDAVVDPKSPISRHPEDYQLFEIGTFDNISGLMKPLIPASFKVMATDFVQDYKAFVPAAGQKLKWDETQMVENNGSKA